MSARAFDKNRLDNTLIKVCDKVKKVKIDSYSLKLFKLDFKDINNCDNLEIIPPSPLSPKELKKSDDTRKLGIGINSLHILKI